MRILLIAPYFDARTPGESWSTYQWVKRLSAMAEVVVLTTHKSGWDASASPTDAVELVNWTEPRLPRSLARLDHELKPGYLLFFLRARRWIKRQLGLGRHFDIVHQTPTLPTSP